MYTIIMLGDRSVMREIGRFRGDQQVQFVKEAIARQAYTMAPAGVIKCELTGEEAADEMFNLTNSPWRQEEREKIYGRERSLSVGDIVIVDGEMFACLSIGWAKL